MNLFVIYIGGSHSDSLIELHDIRFIAANSIEETYDVLRKSWWGIPASLYIDAWGVLRYADGYGIEISQAQPARNSHKLYFVNLGGYAANELEAKQKALIQTSDWESPHRDYLYEVENLLDVNVLLNKEGFYLHLDEQAEPGLFEFSCSYNPIGR